MADEKIIFSMNGVGKVLPHNNKVILKDIYLSFFYGTGPRSASSVSTARESPP